MSTAAWVGQQPKCDTCGAPAEYDYRMRQGCWAYGCRACWRANRMYPDLGTGKGQYLVVKDKA